MGRLATVSRNSSPNLFTSKSFFSHTQPAGVKSNQSLCGVEPISFSLDDFMPPTEQLAGKGGALPWKGALAAAVPSLLREGF